jgi:ribosome-associated protein
MLEIINLIPELLFTTSRSGGKGGQNVNKVETKVEARWHVANTKLFNEAQIELISTKLANKINELGFLQVTASAERTQLANKEIAIKKINKLVNTALVIPKKRKPTTIPAGVIEKRLTDKKMAALKKEMRKGI